MLNIDDRPHNLRSRTFVNSFELLNRRARHNWLAMHACHRSLVPSLSRSRLSGKPVALACGCCHEGVPYSTRTIHTIICYGITNSVTRARRYDTRGERDDWVNSWIRIQESKHARYLVPTGKQARAVTCAYPPTPLYLHARTHLLYVASTCRGG